MRLYIFIIIPIISGILLYLFPKRPIKGIAFGLQVILLGLTIANYVMIDKNGPVRYVLGAENSIAGITLYCDKLIAAFLILTAFIFFVCYLFGLLDKFINHLFIFLFVLLQSLMMTVFMSRDLFNIYVVTEVSTILVAILIMFRKESRSVYDGMFYLISSIAGMSFYLMGTAYLYKIFGVLDIDLIAEKIPMMQNTWELAIPFAFIMTGLSIKCAFIPLFSWLPKAHGTPSAPSIVSVILSGLYVKTGIYLFIVFNQMFRPVLNMDSFFLIIGIATGIAGFMFMLSQKDIKLILAYSTISQMGLILTGLSLGSEYSYYGSILHIFNHAIFKSVLFLCAGIIVERYHTRDITRIHGVFRDMPVVSAAAVMAIFGIIGAPLFNGSVSKYMIQGGATGQIAEYAIIFINLGTILAFIRFSRIFIGRISMPTEDVDIPKKAAVLVMGIMCLVMGFAGVFVIRSIFDFNMSIDMVDYIRKTAVFFISLILGGLLYFAFIRKSSLVKRERHFRIGINGLALAMLLFFATVAFIGYMVLI
ncbi:MAG: proton-conducting transporter membrane subunit [Clostridia bacterium]